jgi:hypothetical protein
MARKPWDVACEVFAADAWILDHVAAARFAKSRKFPLVRAR